ncbi:MAG TPA: hypothetical protein VD790_12575 [Thermoleophilaceae bacterium]|nr:hypothetical protein [Thermoleophilaceae bacterium]
MARRLLALAAFAALVLGMTNEQPRSGAAAAGPSYEVAVAYQKKRCWSDDSEPRLAAVPGALVKFERRGKVVARTRLSDLGRGSTQVPAGAGAVSAWLELESDRLKVSPDHDDPYRIWLGTAKPGENLFSVALNATNEEGERERFQAGALNVWSTSHRGVELAHMANPGKDKLLDQLSVRWRLNRDFKRPKEDLQWSYYMPKGNDAPEGITIDGRKNAGNEPPHEWQDGIILHEVGHWLHYRVALPAGSYPEEHFMDKSYPKHPLVAVSDGFANAYATLAAGSSEVVFHGCKPQAIAEPPKKPIRPAQYNERHAAAAFRGAVQQLANGFDTESVGRGLRKLLGAMRDWQWQDTHPSTMREVRDALLETERTEQDHYDLSNRFAYAGLQWGLRIEVAIDDPRFKGQYAEDRIVLTLDGPGRTCRVNGQPDREYDFDTYPFGWHGHRGPNGDIDHTWTDDCLGTGGDWDDRSSILWLDYPYVRDKQPLYETPYRLKARYECKDERDSNQQEFHCTDDRRLRVIVKNASGETDSRYLTLERNQTKEAVGFMADMHTCVLVDKYDCELRGP